MITASELKPGMAIRIEGQIYKVLESESKAGTAKLGGVVKTKLRNLPGGRIWEPHFRPDEHIEELELERQVMEFLFSDSENCIFMHPQTFEQLEVPREILGPAEQFLQPGMRVPVELYNNHPISVVLPDVVEARVTVTAPPLHAQQDSTWKEATLDNGLKIHVPLFIAPDEMIRVDVRTGRYIERIRTERKRGT